MIDAVLPGATLGVLGSGQLGRMFALAARRMGYRVHVFSPDSDSPTGQVADREFSAAYDDLDALREFAHTVEVVTLEFENIPKSTVDAVNRIAPVRPAGHVLHTTQQRLREKTFLRDAGFAVTPFAGIESAGDVGNLDPSFLPGVLKTAAWGYDGKGQCTVETLDEVRSRCEASPEDPFILEKFVDFEKEVSVVAARGLDGSVVCFDTVENAHANHILDVTVSPARSPVAVAQQAKEIARGVVEKLDVVGVLCVEFFLAQDGNLLINELAPRPHNSGHLTIDAHVTCQFEQQVRAICGLPLGSPEQLRPAAMANLLGDVWEGGEPNWPRACEIPEVKLHLYGKKDAKPGRKMGHLTATADTAETAIERVTAARQRLQER